MSMAPTVPLIWSSAGPIGTATFKDDRGIVGRVVQLNSNPYTILGVAPPEFSGTLLFFSPDFWVPMVDQEQVQGSQS